MASYGRPNVSQYIANLNAIPQAGPAAQQDLSDFDDNLALFTQSELFDFDLDAVKQEDNFMQPDAKAQHAKAGDKSQNVDFANGSNYMFGPTQPMAPLSTTFTNGDFDPQLFPSPQSATFPQQMNVTSPVGQVAGQKRPNSSASPSVSGDDAVRMAAEEDKRRRNTAASARFRVKKKQREAALEKSAKENADRVDNLQKRVTELEMENKWLRELVVQKEGKAGTEAAAKSDPETDVVPVTIAGKQVKKGVGTETTA